MPFGEQIVGTITAIDTFLGVLLGISSANYKENQDLYLQDEMEDEKIDIVEEE